MNKWTFDVYGSDYDVLDGYGLPKEYPSLLELTQSDLNTFAVECLGAYPKYVNEGENKEYLNSYKQQIPKLRMSFSLKYYPVNFPTSETSIENFYNSATLSKKYLWIGFPQDYYLRPANLDTLTHSVYVMRVNFVGLEIGDENGRKSIALNFERIYAG